MKFHSVSAAASGLTLPMSRLVLVDTSDLEGGVLDVALDDLDTEVAVVAQGKDVHTDSKVQNVGGVIPEEVECQTRHERCQA